MKELNKILNKILNVKNLKRAIAWLILCLAFGLVGFTQAHDYPLLAGSVCFFLVPIMVLIFKGIDWIARNL